MKIAEAHNFDLFIINHYTNRHSEKYSEAYSENTCESRHLMACLRKSARIQTT